MLSLLLQARQGAAGGEAKSTAVNVLGTLGALFWSIQLLPQLWLNYRKKDTTGLQPSMMLLWACAGLPLGAHNILGRQNVALQVQAQILTSLSLLTWGQVMYYGHNWSRTRTFIVLAGLFLLFGGAEVAFVLGFKYGLPITSTDAAPLPLILTLAILSALLLSLGVLRHYYDALTHRSVRGISWAFVLLDAAGDLTSLLSVLLDRPSSSTLADADAEGRGGRVKDKDIERWAAAAIYASELALWTGLILLGIVWNGRTWFLKRQRLQRTTSLQIAPIRHDENENALARGGQGTTSNAMIEDLSLPIPSSSSSSSSSQRRNETLRQRQTTSSTLSDARSVFRTSSHLSSDARLDIEASSSSSSTTRRRGGLIESFRMPRLDPRG